jgi:hypothetical protein
MKFFKTTYQTCEDDLSSHLKYQLEFLRTFEMESYDEQTINAELDMLYEKIKDNEQIMAILSEEKKNNHLTNMSDAQSLFLLFSWESLHRLADLMTTSA